MPHQWLFLKHECKYYIRLIDTTTPDQSRPGSNGNEEVLYISQIKSSVYIYIYIYIYIYMCVCMYIYVCIYI